MLAEAKIVKMFLILETGDPAEVSILIIPEILEVSYHQSVISGET